ncbi:aminoglycoside phosphotransferase family protein [Streptomyces sp. XY431]|uniref:aminoglycoside phosphotransferase family protein n=1 Tax=Streptomyces sp. XY431 TaxID=1415562 RepID=UPI0006ADC60D|nr:aminoglycoside phosphotransferase family protein [Streptomyces sp. XY431]
MHGWLARAPEVFNEAARRWQLTPDSYHDAGHASLLMVARERTTGREVLLKAWPDHSRYRNEVIALGIWATGPAVRVLEHADDLGVAALEMVAAVPGGSAGPKTHEYEAVATALRQLHRLGRGANTAAAALPSLHDFLECELVPRVHRRLAEQRPHLEVDWARLGEHLVTGLHPDAARASVLHADVYRENVLFDDRRNPVLADPLPMVGDEVFDWAFWTVYYNLGTDTRDRFEIAVTTAGLDPRRLRHWSLALCVDGLLYYREMGDHRVSVMERVIAGLAGDLDLTAVPEKDGQT